VLAGLFRVLAGLFRVLAGLFRVLAGLFSKALWHVVGFFNRALLPLVQDPLQVVGLLLGRFCCQ